MKGDLPRLSRSIFVLLLIKVKARVMKVVMKVLLPIEVGLCTYTTGQDEDCCFTLSVSRRCPRVDTCNPRCVSGIEKKPMMQ